MYAVMYALVIGSRSYSIESSFEFKFVYPNWYLGALREWDNCRNSEGGIGKRITRTDLE